MQKNHTVTAAHTHTRHMQTHHENACIANHHTYMCTHTCVLMLTAVHDPASVDPDALVKYFPAGQAVHAAAVEPEYVPEAHCQITHVAL